MNAIKQEGESNAPISHDMGNEDNKKNDNGSVNDSKSICFEIKNNQLLANLLVDNVKVTAMIDTGKPTSFIAENFAKSINKEYTKIKQVIDLTLPEMHYTNLKTAIRCVVKAGTVTNKMNFILVPSMFKDVILGLDFFRIFRVKMACVGYNAPIQQNDMEKELILKVHVNKDFPTEEKVDDTSNEVHLRREMNTNANTNTNALTIRRFIEKQSQEIHSTIMKPILYITKGKCDISYTSSGYVIAFNMKLQLQIPNNWLPVHCESPVDVILRDSSPIEEEYKDNLPDNNNILADDMDTIKNVIKN